MKKRTKRLPKRKRPIKDAARRSGDKPLPLSELMRISMRSKPRDIPDDEPDDLFNGDHQF